MKIVCIGKNYARHAQELSSNVPDNPLFFMKPESSVLPYGEPFRLPPFSDEVHYEIEVALRISQRASNVPRADAKDYFDAVGLGLDFTARDLQNELKANGHPWEKCKAFDGAAAVSKEYLSLSNLTNPDEIPFRLTLNGSVVQEGNTKDLIFSFDELISYVSMFVTLEPGDLLFTGTPEGVGPVQPGDQLEGTLSGTKLIDCNVLAPKS